MKRCDGCPANKGKCTIGRDNILGCEFSINQIMFMLISECGKSVAVDFDGTLCEDKYPEIGKPREDIISLVKWLKNRSCKIILWTCRCNDKLQQAIEWCKNHGIEFDAVNENLKEHIEKYNNNTRKVYADYYIDDRAVNI